MERRRTGETTSFTVGGAEFFLTANSYLEGRLGEIFAKFGKQGSTLAGLMDAISIIMSIGIQHGVPLKTYVQKLSSMRFEPMGMTDDPDVPEASSVMDYIARRLALDFLDPETRAELNIFSVDEQARQLVEGSYRQRELPGVGWRG